MLIVFGDNPERVRPEAAFAKLCGRSPSPAVSGMTNRHQVESSWTGTEWTTRID